MFCVGENSPTTLADWIKATLSTSEACGRCSHRHELDDIEEEYVKLPVFVDLSKLSNVLAPVVDALQNSANNKGSGEDDFWGFGDLFQR